jgi:hypothetical protein
VGFQSYNLLFEAAEAAMQRLRKLIKDLNVECETDGADRKALGGPRLAAINRSFGALADLKKPPT